MTRVVGLDVSLTGTGVALFDITDDPDYRSARVEVIETKGKKGATLWERRVRLRTIADSIEQIIYQDNLQPNLAVIEAPSYGSMHGSQHDRSGLWWMVVEMLMSFGIDVGSVPPQTRAKYATGKGNASKDAVLVAVVKAFPDLPIENNNVADAVALAAMGARHLGFALDDDTTTQAKLEAMGGAAWMT